MAIIIVLINITIYYIQISITIVVAGINACVCVCVGICGGRVGHYEDIAIVAVDPPYDDLVTMSTSFQEPNVSKLLAPGLDAGNQTGERSHINATLSLHVCV